MSERPGSVLFVCNHNVIRSPIAAALARARYGDSVYVTSAGVRVGELDPFAIAVMAEIGVDMAAHEPKALEDVLDTWFDVIVTLTPTAHHVALDNSYLECGEIAYWPSGDPTLVTGSRETRLEAYRDVRDRLSGQVDALLGHKS